MGKNVVVLGTQWGDEGKGKIVDLLTDQAEEGDNHAPGSYQKTEKKTGITTRPEKD